MIVIRKVGDQKQYKLVVMASGRLNCTCPESKPCKHMLEFTREADKRGKGSRKEESVDGKDISY